MVCKVVNGLSTFCEYRFDTIVIPFSNQGSRESLGMRSLKSDKRSDGLFGAWWGLSKKIMEGYGRSSYRRGMKFSCKLWLGLAK